MTAAVSAGDLHDVTGAKAKVKISENCKLAPQWNPQDPDENVNITKRS